MRKKIISLIGAGLLVASLCGCGANKELQANYNTLYKRYANLVENETGCGVTCQPTGTGYFAMDTSNTLTVFPEEFGYPHAQSGVPGYTVTFNDGLCSVTPPSGWEVTASGSVIYVYNKEQMVQGQIVPGRLEPVGKSGENAVTKNDLQQYLQNWFTNANSYSFSDIYLGDSSNEGISAHVLVDVDGQTNVVNVGLISDGTTSLYYVFSYAGAENTAKEDLIQSIVSTCKIGDKQVKIM